MITSLREQIVRDEGRRLTVYTDSVGVPTIGVGRNLRDKGISVVESDFLLDNDIRDHTAEVTTAIPWFGQVDTIRQEVLINMSFNMGTAGLLGFHKFLAALKAEDFRTASREMLDSKWATQVASRATRLSQQILLGVRQ